jgi:hypothetical protein
MRCLGLSLFLIVLCASAVFAQDQAANSDPTPAIAAQITLARSTTPEPWRVVPKAAEEPSQPSAQAGDQNLLNVVDSNAQVFGFTTNSRASRALSSQELEQLAKQARSDAEVGQLMNGRVCYSIRSYLMARDSKDSDSTHLVGTSICQPAQKYALKTTVAGPHLVQP